MARYLAIRNNYVINAFIWDGVEYFTYPGTGITLIEDSINEGRIGDYYDSVEETFTTPETKPSDPNYPEELDYLWIPLEIETGSVISNWGAYIGNIGNGTSSESYGQVITVHTDSNLILVFQVVEGDISSIDDTVSGFFEGTVYTDIIYDSTMNVYIQGPKNFSESDTIELFFKLTPEAPSGGLKINCRLIQVENFSPTAPWVRTIARTQIHLFKE